MAVLGLCCSVPQAAVNALRAKKSPRMSRLVWDLLETDEWFGA